MEVRQLEYFVAVCDHMNMTKAAEYLHVAQPSITNSIKRLEAELDVKLFNRIKKKIEITEEGKIFYSRCKEILTLMDDAKEEMQDFNRMNKGTLSIGIPPMIGTYLFPSIFSAFKKQYPEVELKLHEFGSVETRNLLINKALDLAIVITSDLSDDLMAHEISRSKIVLCVGENHALAEKKTVSFKEIIEEPVILLKEGFYHRAIIMSLYEQNGAVPNEVLSSSQLETIKAMVAEGEGISFLLEEIIDQRSDIVAIPLEEELEINIGVAWHKDKYLSKLMKLFKDFVVKEFGGNS